MSFKATIHAIAQTPQGRRFVMGVGHGETRPQAEQRARASAMRDANGNHLTEERIAVRQILTAA